MLHDCSEAISLDIQTQKRILQQLKKRRKSLEYLGNDYLTVKETNGKKYYYRTRSIKGKQIKHYINKRSLVVRHDLQEKHFIDAAIIRCQNNIEALEAALLRYKPIDPVSVSESLGDAYREQINANRMIFGYDKVENWIARKESEKEAFRAKYGDYMMDNHKHISSNGEGMVSKSELAMTELLTSMGIPFVYEVPRFFNGEILRPDFIVLNTRTGKEYYFEHVGYLANYAYSKRHTEKLVTYARAGIIPNENILFTYENLSGNLNLKAARKMLETFLK